MNLMPLADHLESRNLGVQGKSIFINMMPASCSQGILLRNKLTGTAIDYELPNYFKASFQVIVRASEYTVGEQLAKDVIEAMTLNETQIAYHFFKFVRPQTLPSVFPLSDGNMLEFNISFDAVFMEAYGN